VSEEFAFNQVFWNGCAVDFDERCVGAGAFPINGAGYKFLSGATFSLNKDGCLGACHFSDERTEVCHAVAMSEEFVV